MNGTSKGLCIVVDNLPPAYSGAGQQALTLSKAFRRMGVDTVLVGKAMRGLPLAGVYEGVEVFRVPSSPVRSLHVAHVHHAVRLLALLLQLRSRYDVVLFFDPEGGFRHSWLILPILHLLGKRTAARMTLIDSSDPVTLSRRRLGLLRLMPYRLHHRIVSISTALTRSYRQVFGTDSKLVSIPNGVDIERFRPITADERYRLRLELGLDQQRLYACFVGRISHRKGVDIIIEAWAQVVARVPTAVLLLVGPTADEYRNVGEADFVQQVSAAIARLGIENNVVWTGATTHVERYLQAADVFVFASRREGCPNAVLEALASGLPVVTAALPGITDDLISSGVDGVIAEPTAESLARETVALLRDQARRSEMSARARQRAVATYSIEASAMRYLQVFSEQAA